MVGRAAAAVVGEIPDGGRGRRDDSRRMTALLPELGSVRLRETEGELVIEVDVPEEVDVGRLSARVVDGVLTISLPRVHHIVGFNPDAEAV